MKSISYRRKGVKLGRSKTALGLGAFIVKGAFSIFPILTKIQKNKFAAAPLYVIGQRARI